MWPWPRLDVPWNNYQTLSGRHFAPVYFPKPCGTRLALVVWEGKHRGSYTQSSPNSVVRDWGFTLSDERIGEVHTARGSFSTVLLWRGTLSFAHIPPFTYFGAAVLSGKHDSLQIPVDWLHFGLETRNPADEGGEALWHNPFN